MQCLLHGLQQMIVKIIDIKHSPPWDEINIMKELNHPAIVKVTLFCFFFLSFFSFALLVIFQKGSVTPCNCDFTSKYKANDEY